MSFGTEDLSAKARRTELDDDGRKRLRLALEASLEARLLHRAGCEFDTADVVLPGDDQLADRIVRRMLKSGGTRRRSRARAWIVAAAAACVAAGAAAAALPITQALIAGGEAGRTNGAPPDRGPSFGTAHGQPGNEGKETPSRPGPTGSAQARGAPASEPGKPPVERAGPSARIERQRGDDAATLFARANLARREQRIREAMALYDQIERRFPQSPEARAAEIVLGTLHLQSADASASLRQYRRYLAGNPHGELSPEALWGEAQSLSALGRIEEARRSWRLLIERFPESVYAKAARLSLERTR